MCFGDDARLPLPPVRGGAVGSDDLILTSADGTDVRDDAWRRMLDFIARHGGS